ncbi:EpsG family protein [bacterium]|nr:EpsG family protein [bacterium]
MYIYFICLAIIFTAFLFEEKAFFLKKKNFNKAYLFWGISLLLTLVSALRFNVGMDYETYLRIYSDASISVHEYGFQLINSFSKMCGFPAQFTIACFSVATIFFAFKFIKDTSKRPFFSILIFYTFSPFFLQSLNVMRQMLAVFIFAYSLKFIKEEKMIIYFLFIICGAFFAHQTILITLPLYFILNKNIDNKIHILLILFTIFSGPIVLKIIQFTPYSYYIDMVNSQGVHNMLSITFMIELLLSYIIVFKVKGINTPRVYKNMCFILMYFSSFIFLNSSSIIGILLERILWYFLPIIIIYIPTICDNETKYKWQYTFFFCAIFISLFSLSIIINGTANKIVPYQSIFKIF